MILKLKVERKWFIYQERVARWTSCETASVAKSTLIYHHQTPDNASRTSNFDVLVKASILIKEDKNIFIVMFFMFLLCKFMKVKCIIIKFIFAYTFKLINR